MNESIIEQVWHARDNFLRTRPESLGTPIINGIELTVLPPWANPEEGDILRIRIRGVGVCCFSPSHRGILVVHNPEPDFPQRWDLPSGHVEATDLSLAHAATRELNEETGIVADPRSCELLSYGWRVRKGEKTGGIQYVLFAEPQIPEEYQIDPLGRIIFKPPAAVNPNEVQLLAIEPIAVFMNPGESLLRYSPYSWAYSHTREDLRSRAGRIIRESNFKTEV